ncbi:MAG: class I SAM-dependent methyltransferase [bacterium]|nr:class I SAM-dependent methyltransferase [bacterium]
MAERKINLDEIARFWDGNAETWAKHVAEGWDITRDYYQIPAFLELVGDISGLRILDAGCGDGTNTRTFARLGGDLTGIDLSEKMIRFAREHEQDEPLGVNYFIGSYSDLDRFDDAEFDTVLSTMALMDGPDFDGTMREFYRVLRPGGKMAFSILHPVFTCGDRMEWVHDEDGAATGLVISDYFTRKQYVAKWGFSAHPNADDIEHFEIPHFPRILSQYVNGVCGAGFMLEAIAEPRPGEEMVRKFPEFGKLRKHASFLFLLKATKPE